MNGPEKPVFQQTKLPASPRPPAVGEEVSGFHDVSCLFPEHYKSSLKKMEENSQFVDNPNKVLQIKEIQAETDNDADASLTNPSPPPPFKWAQSLQCLLEDAQGVALFEQFLKQEGHDTRSLSFWFACRGVKKTNPNNSEKLHKLIHVLYDKKVKRIAAISSATKSEIQLKLSSNTGVDVNIFDAAQREVEADMLKTTYPNFLNSDLYIQLLGTVHNEPVVECPLSPEVVDLLPTVHEDSELNFSVNKMHHVKETFLSRRKIPLLKTKPETQAGMYLKSPYGSYSSYHTKYASFLPASAQDSELQSLSSDAQTDDTMSQTDSSVDYPMHSRKQKRQQKSKHFGPILNKDRLAVNNFIPRTQRPLGDTSQMPKSPAEFHALLVKKLNRLVDEQETKDKVYQRLKTIEAYDSSRSEGFSKLPKFDSSVPNQSFLNFCGPSEDNVQDILDQHVSRVFEDTGLTPTTMSPICASPPVAKRTSEDFSRIGFPGGFESLPQDYSNSQRTSSNPVPYNMRYKRDHDTRSNDSGALTDWISEDNLPACHRAFESSGNPEPCDYSQSRRSREQLKRYISKKPSSMTDSSSSCVDSGISVACESVQPSHSKVTHWLETKRCSSETEKEHIWKNSSTSPVLSRSSSTRKAVIYNSSRSGALEAGSWALVPSTQDSTLPPPDTTTNLIEARRRLEDESRTKMGKSKYVCGSRSSHENTRGKVSSRACDSVEDGISHRKQSKKSSPSTMESSASNVAPNDVTIIGYSYGRGSVPYKSRLPGKNITLRQFKSLLNKKGNFRYFFKRVSDDFGTGVVLEEVIDDYEVLPLWEGKVFCVIEAMEDVPTANEDC